MRFGLQSNALPVALVHSIEPSCGAGSPEMETTTRGGQSLGSSPRRVTSDHHEFPIMIAVGGGCRRLKRDGDKSCQDAVLPGSNGVAGAIARR